MSCTTTTILLLLLLLSITTMITTATSTTPATSCISFQSVTTMILTDFDNDDLFDDYDYDWYGHYKYDF
eukprot:2638336-Pyramimonas_sp.AAC.1